MSICLLFQIEWYKRSDFANNSSSKDNNSSNTASSNCNNNSSNSSNCNCNIGGSSSSSSRMSSRKHSCGSEISRRSLFL